MEELKKKLLELLNKEAGMIGRLIIALIALAFTSFSFASDTDQITITTYYPAPAGSYNELRTYNNTYLATDGGRVGIGTMSPSQKLDVSGDAIVTGNLSVGSLSAVIYKNIAASCGFIITKCSKADGTVVNAESSCPSGYSLVRGYIGASSSSTSMTGYTCRGEWGSSYYPDTMAMCCRN